ncbi:hypothetical protein B0J11DRAFT_531081 [Dendryphion nanum]|uniref:Structural maintenance of chromosomes protein 5 n=1 Tax=Dendryphion nanum TaxID=256645 RepID=A0A9P9IHJ0_9PLEO|nr:hypothetical protein B0J11DRAFT_531081 [Dendryphion nanum]
MPGFIRSGRKRPSPTLTDDEDQPSPATSSISVGIKRARHARDASEDSELPADPRSTARRAQGDDDDQEYVQDEHQPGSIIRVKLRNFVTYTAAEFHLGPSLNMIIGPNGTGKSTLVCAICLGLGWKSEHLGRAKDIGEFVKHGSTEAEIEIELAAGPNHRTNPVIRRTIRKEGNKSAFFINGRPSTQKEATRLAKSFSIQIDNLCQFLPQDRVVEFARLSPEALLVETQRAVASEEMVQWHDDLKRLYVDQKRLQNDEKKESSHLASLQNTQNNTREDVERHEERLRLVAKEEVLRKYRPYIESRIVMEQHNQVKLDKRVAQDELKQLEADIAPTRQAQEDAEDYRAKIDSVRKARTSVLDSAKQHVEKSADNIKRHQETEKDLEKEVEAERTGEKQRKADVQRLQGIIQQCERQMKDPPASFDQEAYVSRRAEIRAKIQSADTRFTDLDSQRKELVDQAGRLQNELTYKRSERTKMNTQSGQLASRLQNISRDTAQGWDWFENNKPTLKLHGKVEGPPILTCSITDPKFAQAVESSLKAVDITAITCTDSRDARFLSNKLIGELGLHQVSIRTIPQPLAYYRHPVTPEELAGYGLAGWLLNYMQGPDAVLAMLCDSAGLHRIAFTPDSLSDEQHKAIESGRITQWIAGTQKFKITRRREYGQSSNSVSDLGNVKYFTNQPVDTDNSRLLEQAIQDLERDIAQIKTQHEALKPQYLQARSDVKDAKSEIEDLNKEKDAIQRALSEWGAIPRKKADKQRELDSLKAVMKDTSSRIREHKINISKASLKAANAAIDYVKSVSMLPKLYENLVEAEIRFIEAESEVESLKVENLHIHEALEHQKKLVSDLKERQDILKRKYNQLVATFKRDMDSFSQEELRILEDYNSLSTVEELDNEIDLVNSKLTMMAGGNPHAVKQYQLREVDIAKSQEKLQRFSDELENAKRSITVIREQWEPKLDDLAARISDGFSHNFTQIGCAGQVSIYKDEEDFERWSIQIQVRFRNNENLSILDSQRQSGGERSVSTIFYLMALQDLARSPFRVVDEINQGMDPRNERKVHERMVDIACRENTSQYLLITPKLLSELKFHPKMKVHCIASGEHMPERGHEKLDFASLAKLAIRVHKGEVTATA